MENNKIKYQNDSLGASLVYTLDADEKIDAFSNGMLVNNNIKGILVQSYEINNNVRTLSYTVSRGIPLSTLIKQSLKKQVILTILKNISDVLVRVNEYMMDTDNVLLENEYIFIDTSTLDAGMILIPTNKPYGKPFRAFIKNCIVTGVFDVSEDTSYVMQISNFLNINSNASVKDISAFFDSLLQNKTLGSVPSMTSSPNPVPFVQPSVQQPNSVKAPVKVEPMEKVPQPAPIPGVVSQEPQAQKKGLFGGKFDKKEKKPAKPAPSVSGSFAGMQIPGMSSDRAPSVPQQPAKPEKPSKAGKSKPFTKNDCPMPIPPSSKGYQQPVQPQQAYQQPVQPQYQGYQQPVPMAAQAFQSADIANSVSGQSDSEATVLLNLNSGSSGRLVGVLEHRNGTSVMIDKDCFFIGKGTNTVVVNDLVIKNENVSRNHAVIERFGSVYNLKDNNSLNGTFLNGQRLTPNIQTELKNGDKVVFANEEYTFMIKRV